MTPLQEKTYALLKTVPAGHVTTYKALAEALHTKAYRAIGQFMKHNPYAPTVPCHRVIASDATIGGFMGAKSGKEITKKIRMLRSEGIKITGERIIDFSTLLFHFQASGDRGSQVASGDIE